MIDLNITNEEIDALKLYMNNKYEAINQMLVSDAETDIALLSDDVENKSIDIMYSREAVIQYLKTIKLIYKLILKNYYSKKYTGNIALYRGTNIAEVERIKNELFIDRFLAVTENKADAENKYSAVWNRPACLNILLENNVPYIYIEDILKDDSDTILISPFTKIKRIGEDEESKLEKNSKSVKNYNIILEKQELDELTDRERNGLYDYILENSYFIKRKIEECIDLEKENTINFENIRKLEQLVNKYETNEDIKEDFEENISSTNNVENMKLELEELKEKSNRLFKTRKENIKFVSMWKRNIAVYMIAECREIEKEFEEVKLEFSKNKDEKIEIDKKEIKEKNIEETKVVPIVENIFKEEAKEETTSVITLKTCEENIEMVQKLISDINDLISKQQNHAKIAGNIGCSYSALNNAFAMRKSAEKLLVLVKNINDHTQELIRENEESEIEEKLNVIQKTNLEISTLINYLNNPKIAEKNTQITRFDEMKIIEENELKRKIAEKIRDIRGEAELKKLKDDYEIIEEKGTFSRILGFFTGQNRLDEFMIEQIEIRENAIRKTLSGKMSLAKNYSIHELIAEIKMFIDENEDDELVEQDISELNVIEEELKKNYIILETKVNSIIEEKEGRNLPVNDKKVSRAEMLEIETYRFLNKYGYDLSSRNEHEPEYQDTMTNEINRIIEYIEGSKI